MLYLGWIAAAFMGGILFAWRHGKRQKPSTLRSRFSVVDHFQGMRYDDILCRMRVMPQKTEYMPDGRVLRTWCEQGYAITLMFDEGDLCLGVADEQY